MSLSKYLRSPATALALGASLVTPVSAVAQTQFPKECALKEIPAITLIEDHGEAGNISGDRLTSAWLAVLDARAACSDGRVNEGLALYDDILKPGAAQHYARNPAGDSSSR